MLSVRQLLPYTAASAVAAVAVVAQALSEYHQFYPAMVAISHSSLSLAVLCAFVATLCLSLYSAIIHFLFGELRRIEVSNIREQLWYTVFEALMALTMFREEINAGTVSFFLVLLGFKIMHWILKDRVNFMLQSLRITWRFHISIVVAASIVFVFSSAHLAYVAYVINENGVSIRILFGFEYLIYAVDMQRTDPWEQRALYLSVIDIITDFIRLVGYVAFFFVLVNFYTVPLYLLRDVFMTFMSFMRRFRDFFRARRVLVRLSAALTDATAEDLQANSACNICLEEMTSAKKLPCGHIFHLNCLRRWLQENQTCPACRADLDLLTNRAQQQQRRRHRRQQPHPPPQYHQQQGHPAPPHNQGQPPPPPSQQQQAQQMPSAHRNNLPQEPPTETQTRTRQVPTTPTVSQPGEERTGTPQPPVSLPPMNAFPYFGNTQFPLPPLPPPPPFLMEFDFQREFNQQGLSTLSPEELIALEGDEREKVEQRIRFLQQMRLDIDCLVARFDQYQSVARSEHQHISSTSTDTWRQVTTQDHMNQNLTVGPSNNPSDKEQNIFNKISSGSQPDKEVDLTAGPTALSQERKTEELQQSYPTSSEGNQISEDSPSRSLQSIRLRRLQALSRSSLQDSSSAPSTPIQDKDESSK
eukprot:gene1405-4572_t